MKLLRRLGKSLSNVFSRVEKEFRWLFYIPPYPSACLVVLIENQDLREQELFDEMMQLEKRGCSILVLSSIRLRNICRDEVTALWALEKREEPMPQWIFLIGF